VFQVGVTDRLVDAARLLQAVPGVAKVNILEEAHPELEAPPDAPTSAGDARVLQVAFDDAVATTPSDLPSRLVNAGFRITRFAEEPVNLETAFMRLTKGLVQ
jgi:hypothetical protein